MRRKMGMARVFLSGGADIHAVDNDGDTILHVLARNLDSEPLRALFEELVGGAWTPTRGTRGERRLYSPSLCARQISMNRHIVTLLDTKSGTLRGLSAAEVPRS